MTERTYNIIMACKHRPENTATITDSVRIYMSNECDCPIHHYSERQINRIMKTAMYDYIDTCDKPSVFLRSFDDVIGKEDMSIGEQIAIAFSLVRVCDGARHYVNGFGEWMK